MRSAATLLIVGAIALLVLLSLSSEDVEGASTPPASGTWTIGAGETVTHSLTTFDLFGDLHVRGTLEMDNCTLWVWLDASAPRELVVYPGGELRLVNSAIASAGLGRAYVVQAEEGSDLVLDRSSIWRAGDRLTIGGRYSGVHVATDSVRISGTQFMEGLVGLWVSATDATATDCTFIDCRYGAVVDTGGRLTLDGAHIQMCTIGALSNASMMTVRNSVVTGCEEGILAYGGNLTVLGTDVSNCSIVGVGSYSAETTMVDCLVHDAEADGVVVHTSRAWITSCEFIDLDTDVKVVHSTAWLAANRHQNTLNEAMWMYHATFHAENVTTRDSYWALRGWKSQGVCLDLTAINATFGVHLERCEDVLIDGMHMVQENRTRRQTARGLYVTGGSFTLTNSTITGVRTGIDMLSASGTVRGVRIDDCYQDGVMISLSWFYTMSDVNVTRADDGYWLNLYSGGRLERCVASLCRATGFNFSAGATTTLVECNSSANPVGLIVNYASPVLRDCEMYLCDDRWRITNETLGMDLFSGAPRILGGSVVGGFGGILLNNTRALVEGVTFTHIDRWSVQVRESTGDTISDCTFINTPNATAIFVWRGAAVIEGNAFYRVNYGITGADGSHLIIKDNVIENVTYDGIWIVANSSAVMEGNLIRDIGFYGVHAMLYSTVTSKRDVVQDVGSRGVFVWKASSFDMRSGALINCTVAVYAFDAIDVRVSFTEVRDQNRGIISYKDMTSNALTHIQHVTVEGCYLTNHSAYAIGVFGVNLTVVDCNFLDNIAAIQARNASVDILDSSMVGSWLYGIQAEGSTHVTWLVEGRCRILSSDIYGHVDIIVNGGDLLMEDLVIDPTAKGSLRSGNDAKVVLRHCEWRAHGASVQLTFSEVVMSDSTFTAVGPPLGGSPGSLGVTVHDSRLEVFRCTFSRTRTGLSLVRTEAVLAQTQFTECGEFGIYARDSRLELVATRINRTMVGDALHLDNSTMNATRSGITIAINGLVMEGSQATLWNCSMGGASTHSLSVSRSTLVLMNTTYQTDRIQVVHGGEVEVWWLVTAVVIWPDPGDLASTTVRVEDASGRSVATGQPDAGGTVRWMPILALVHRDGGDGPHGPHSVSAHLFGYTVSVTVNLISSRNVELDLKDEDPPTFEVLGPLKTEVWTRSGTLTVFGWALDEGAGTEEVRVYTDYTPTSMRSEGEAFSFAVPLSDGRHVIELKATDLAGNSATYTLVVWVERDPLLMSPPEPGDGTLTRDRSVVLRGRVSRVEGVTIRVNRVLATIDAANRSYSVEMDLLEGANAFSILAEDVYGHETWFNLTITADWTAPDLVMTTPIEVNTTDEWVEVAGTVDADARLYIQGSLVLLREGAFSVKYPVYVGETAIHVRAEDDIGNSQELDIFVFRWEVSTEPPGPDPREVYIFLVIIPIMVVVVYVFLRRIEHGGDGP